MYSESNFIKHHKGKSIAHTSGGRNNEVKQRIAFEDNRETSTLQALQILDSSTIQRIKSATLSTAGVIQRLSHEYYDKAELRYSSRAFAHLSQSELEQYLWDNQSEIVVGQDQTILIGGGLRTGYAVNGNIKYNCYYDENAGHHVIYVYHAHAEGRMG